MVRTNFWESALVMKAFNFQYTDHAPCGDPEMMGKRVWSEVSDSVSYKLPGEPVPAAVVVGEDRRAPEQWWEEGLLRKGGAGTPWRAGLLAGESEGLQRGVLMVWTRCRGGNYPSARGGEAWK